MQFQILDKNNDSAGLTDRLTDKLKKFGLTAERVDYSKTLFPQLKDADILVESSMKIRQQIRPWIFYETKSNLSLEQFKIMKQARVDAIQPGVESFSDIILEIMGKGGTGLQNIQFLKWTEQIWIWPFWNILARKNLLYISPTSPNVLCTSN